uniref:Uncharacterized protein LOC104227388 n=1 Tax=Nicotiana sylvestris TaxID=4096 RepID=A0A1U7WKX0_NICSY|nr:PREDICTED: uncharacterized protein LOC104227388 [Nicotiana sylvestris]
MAEEQPMAVQEVAMPSIANVTSSIVKPRITGHFELKQSMIHLIHANGQFMGLPHDDPQQHSLNFLEISDAYITNGVTPDYERLTLFPFSLLGEAKRWLKQNQLIQLHHGMIWQENFWQAWERFKGLLRDSPHHNQMHEVLDHTFIEGLHSETKIVVDAAAGGQVLEKSFDEIYALLNKFSKSNPDWQGEMGRHTVQKSVGVLELDVVSALSAQIAILTNQVNQMNLSINKKLVQQVQIFCEACGEGHMSNIYPENPESVYLWVMKIEAKQISMGTLTIPTGGTTQTSLGVETRALKINTGLKNLNSNIDHLRPVGALPSDIEPNPKAQVNAVTLRNGRALEEVPKKKKNTDHPEGELAPKPVEGNEKDDKGPKPVIETRPPPPFPQRLQKQKNDAKYKKFLDILSQVSVNLPLVEILQEVPKYARFLRDIVANKRRHAEFETVALTEECSARVQSKLPPKLKDPGSFTIPLSLGKQEVGRALCDLGASINLMPSSLFKQLGLGALRPTTITLQIADRSLFIPEGIIEDVLVRVGKFILPADFIVLDYEKALNIPKHYEDLCMITMVESKGTKQSPYVNFSDPDGTIELKEVVFRAERVKMIEKKTRDERGDLPRVCKKARRHGRKKKRKRSA